MADAVQALLERMIPDLEELQELGIFSKEEIKAIVGKRRDYEYLLQRRAVRKMDYLRYIAYEMNLDDLRKRRKRKLSIMKTCRSDHSSVKQIHSIFERAVRKFKGDVQLWLQFIAFCRQTEGSRVLSQLFTRALQFHPRVAGIWIEAASWELFTNANVQNARVLMQRALRVNAEEQSLWLEYFRFEMIYLQKLLARRAVLGLDKEEKEKLDIPELETEKEIKENDADQEARGEDVGQKTAGSPEESAQERIFSGEIPKEVYKQAIKAFPIDVPFREKFLDITSRFPTSVSSHVEDFVLQSLEQDFEGQKGKEEEAWKVRTEWPIKKLKRTLGERGKKSRKRGRSKTIGEEEEEMEEVKRLRMALEETERDCQQLLQAAVEKLSSEAIWEFYLLWVESRIAEAIGGADQDLERTARLAQHLLGEYERAESEGKLTSPSLFLRWITLLQRTGAFPRLLEVIEKAVRRFPSDGRIWAQAVEVWVTSNCGGQRKKKELKSSETARSKEEEEENIARVVATAQKLRGPSAVGLWLRLIDYYSSAGKTAAATRKVFETAIKCCLQVGERDSGRSLLQSLFIRWVYTSFGLEEARETYKQVLREPLSRTTETLELLQLMLRLELAQSQRDKERIVHLYELLADIFGSSRADVWLDYLSFLRASQEHTKANNVAWRARKELKDPEELALLTAESALSS